MLKAQVSNLCVLQLYDYQAAVCTFVQDLYQTRPEGSMPQLYYAPQRPSQTLTNAALNWRLSFADVLVFWLASYSLEARQPSKILNCLTWFNQVYWQQVDNNVYSHLCRYNWSTRALLVHTSTVRFTLVSLAFLNELLHDHSSLVLKCFNYYH